MWGTAPSLILSIIHFLLSLIFYHSFFYASSASSGNVFGSFFLFFLFFFFLSFLLPWPLRWVSQKKQAQTDVRNTKKLAVSPIGIHPGKKYGTLGGGW